MPWPRKSHRKGMTMSRSETRCKCRPCRQCRRSPTVKSEGVGRSHYLAAAVVQAPGGCPHHRAGKVSTPSTPSTLGVPTPSSPTHGYRWSGGQRPARRTPSMSSRPRPDGLWRTSRYKTISPDHLPPWTTSEVVWAPATLRHRAKLCADSPHVFLWLFSFEERAHD